MNENQIIFDGIIAPFERLLSCHICFHDYTGEVRPWLTSDRSFHLNDFCSMIKGRVEGGWELNCINCDKRIVQTYLHWKNQGFFKLCHAGVVECVVPLRHGDSILAVMFCGPFSWEYGKELPSDFVIDDRYDGQMNSIEIKNLSVPPINTKNHKDILSIMSTLGEHLEAQINESTSLDSQSRSFRWRVQEYLKKNFSRELSLSDLATEMGLSESRLGHKIKEVFDTTYPDLINRFRIEHAKALLSNTALKIHEISKKSGFKDPAYFHKVFKKHEKSTPKLYRKGKEAESKV